LGPIERAANVPSRTHVLGAGHRRPLSTPSAFRRAAALAEGGTLGLGRLVTLRVPLREASRGFDSLVARDGLKVIVEPGGS
jgi:threonine dehydrogenase-like Zn-dependent dehydrogenase